MANAKKLIAMLLIFTLSFVHFATVTEAIATTDFVSILTGQREWDVRFNGYFVSDEAKSESLISDVNNDDLSIYLELGAFTQTGSGYLKDGKIEILPEDEQELNFVIKEENNVEENDVVQSLSENVIKLNKIESSNKTDFSDKIIIPIQYKNEEYMNEAKLKASAKIVLSGIYVDNNGEENEISKEVNLILGWKDNREVKVDEEISKYIKYSDNGAILQTVIKVDNSNENPNSLPTNETKVNINVPKINDTLPSEVSVIANSTMGTNGKGVGDAVLGENDVTYNKEEGRLSITVANEKKLVDIVSDEYLKEENQEVKQEERYYSKAGVDEFVVTYTYNNVELSDKIESNSKIEAVITTLSGDEEDSISSIEKNVTYTLEGQTGNLISYTIENETKEISKAYAYLGKEVELNSKTAINVSYKDIVNNMIVEDVENYYVDKNKNKIEVDDIYYKQIAVNKENFNEILGEDGSIKILDISGNELSIINKENSTDENGNYIVNFKEKISKIKIETSAPINTGNLVISNKKAVSNIGVQSDVYAQIDCIATKTIQKAKFEYVSDIVDLESITVETKLNDTTTDINLSIDKDSLSTVVTNSNVEMRLALNNDKETSDIYGNSVFEIEMPKNVSSINVTNASILNGEGLEISKVDAYKKDDHLVIKIIVTGEQKDFNSGVLTNGTNIVLNADITVDNYTSSEDAKIKAYVLNRKATNYANNTEYTIDNNKAGYQEISVKYSAPSGLFAVNGTSNYSKDGKSIISIKQGEKVDYLDIYSESKNAKMDIAVINNNDEAVSNIAILGRIPFKGVKNIVSNEDIGTTLDTKLLNKISDTEGFVIYYSENGEATKDLNEASNGWIQNPEKFDNIKSYLIVPQDSNYKLESRKILKFSYEYAIPENLSHNHKIFGTFAIYYTDELGGNEAVAPDLVGLSTGAGPELSFDLTTDKKEIMSNDELQITAVVKNIGADIAQNVVTNITIPENTEFVSTEADKDAVKVEFADGKVNATIENLAVNAEQKIVVKVKAKNIDENNAGKLAVLAKVTAKDLGTELSKTVEDVVTKASELSLKQYLDLEDPNCMLKKGISTDIYISASNLTKNNIENTKVEINVPSEIIIEETYVTEKNSKGEKVKTNNVTKDGTKLIFDLETLNADNTKSIYLKAKIGDLENGITEKQAKFESKVYGKDTKEYKAEDLVLNLGKSSLSIVQTSTTPVYINEGENIYYTFNVKNEGPVFESEVLFTDTVPNGLVVKEISYEIGDSKYNVKMSEKKEAFVTLDIPGKTDVIITVKALALDLNGVDELSVTNEAKISSSEIDEISSNKVVHIVKANSDKKLSNSQTSKNDINTVNSVESNSNNTSTNSSNTNNNSSTTNTNDYTSKDITKSYKIMGIAWNDSNNNGMREDNESRMSDVTAMLVDSSSGVIKGTTKTNAYGEYTFAGVQNGTYLVIFKYDTTRYTTAIYRKEGIESNINSDAVVTKIEQNGRKENGAVTDRLEVNGANLTNIDIGLVEMPQFSLNLDKSISKITVQNAEGTVTEEFSNTKLAKHDIAAKYLAGTTVYVEYTFKVTNNGDLAGYASEIVDYIPQGMTFNSNLNSDWYTGTDGNLYTKALANTEIGIGESKDIKLVLIKQMTAENTGLINNTAEISDDYNIYGISDKNSKPANRAQGEDDMSTADAILTVKTGESLVYVSALIISIIAGGAVALVVYERVLKNKRNGGV